MLVALSLSLFICLMIVLFYYLMIKIMKNVVTPPKKLPKDFIKNWMIIFAVFHLLPPKTWFLYKDSLQATLFYWRVEIVQRTYYHSCCWCNINNLQQSPKFSINIMFNRFSSIITFSKGYYCPLPTILFMLQSSSIFSYLHNAKMCA